MLAKPLLVLRVEIPPAKMGSSGADLAAKYQNSQNGSEFRANVLGRFSKANNQPSTLPWPPPAALLL